MGDAAPRGKTVVDVFAGCGGLSLGAQQAGFVVGAAVDCDSVLASSYPVNFPHARVVLEDVRGVTGEKLVAAAGGSVTGLVGGPPCQGFSDIGKRDPRDPRRGLLGEFFRLVLEVRPCFFVMENVRGLTYSGSQHLLEDELKSVAEEYGILGPKMWNAADFGAATNRTRLFVIGVHKDRGEPLREDEVAVHARGAATVEEAIGDLVGAEALGEEDGLDVWRIAQCEEATWYANALRAGDRRFTGHRVTKHSAAVVARFEEVPQGGIDRVGRHPRLAWAGQCPAIRAGTGRDHGSHQALRPIHPEEPRVITVREAARLQGFPDAHRFHSAVWHSFRMIGNSVSPMMGKAILAALGNRAWNV